MIHDFISLLFPEYCLMCEEGLKKEEKLICIHCRYKLPKTHSHLDNENYIARKFWGKLPVRYAWAYLKFTKKGNVQRILHKLKYDGYAEVGELLGKWYGYELKEAGLEKEFDLILPVPLHISKLKKRGYNQSDTIAKGMSEAMQVEWSEKVLIKNIASETQTKKKRLERWENVEKVFDITNKDKIIGKRILLVDDVVTTGSTLEACCKLLLDEGCKEVSIATIAGA